ncbi:helix-turn-helix transcriptional regulator [Actinocorallia populi]|uniref:helix-turn-helix transcriptional regulator n=1 Tax=Actinocorallia populi TaxID=2079200 RepID=UPI000D08B830|nr:helix-turn-helix transcriptional regulator [Actinocorallia populi]
MYTERAAPEARGTLWRNRLPSGPYRVLPDGCLDLIWTGGEVIVAGPDTGPRQGSGAGQIYIGLRLASGTGPSVLGVPAREFTDRQVPLSDVWGGARARELAERLAGANAPGRVLADAAAARLAEAGPADPVVGAALAGLDAGEPVSLTAVRAGLSERQLHRRCLDAFGYGLKTLARIRRMTRAVSLIEAGTPQAEAAFRAGYADQAHLAREVKALTGVPPSAFRPTG